MYDIIYIYDDIPNSTGSSYSKLNCLIIWDIIAPLLRPSVGTSGPRRLRT